MISRCCLLLFLAVHGSIIAPAREARRLEVLFLGDDRGHKPIERYRVLKQALGPQGINLTFTEDLATINRANLDLYDALLVYANHEKDQVPEAILPWVRDGGALVALHSACGNFHPSKAWFDLVGGRFQSHEGHVFSPKTVDADHPITRDLPVLTCWDETYIHRDLTAGRHLLQVREPMNKDEQEPQPWTWTRDEGKGRVFYTASGHDLRCWKETAYQILVKRGILWAVGAARAKEFGALKLPALEIETPVIEGRTHPDIPMMALQKPLSPEASAAHAQVPAGTRLQLFASEPMVINPIAIDWDTRGRAWVVESFAYPNDVPLEPGSGRDRIKILEDTDGDGKADKMSVFVDDLRHCTTSVFANGGVVVTDGPDILFLRDDDGDDQADTRKVLATGLNMNDTHASTSHFLYGLDNWIYATVGYSGVDIDLAGKKSKFGSSVFRFRPDLSALQHLQRTTNNTWGLGFTEQGDVMGSTANNNPSWILSIPSAAYAGSGIEPGPTPRADTATTIYPNTLDITQVDQIDRYTAAAGHQFYTDNLLENVLQSNHVLVCEPTGHVVGLGTVEDRDSLKATHFRGNNLFASADAWSSPVAARSGPDGAVWIADWYNPIIQHNVVFRFWNPARGYDYPHSPYQIGAQKPGKGNAYVTPLRDQTHGRIWRVIPAEGAVRKSAELDPNEPATLIAALQSPSQHTRLHAQRLLIERGKPDVVPELISLITAKPVPAIHAIWALQGLGAAPGSPAYQALETALAHENPLLRRHAMLALGAGDPAVVRALPGLITTTANPRELLLVISTAAQAPSNEPLSKALWQLASRETKLDATQSEAMRLALRRQGSTLLAVALAAELPDGWAGQEILEIAKRVAASPNRSALVAMQATAPAGVRAKLDEILSAAPATAAVEPVLPGHLLAGQTLYLKACIECHQADGKGVEKTFPPLVDSEWVKGDSRTLLRIMLGGVYGPIKVNGVDFNSAMPGHIHLTDEEIATTASFVRHAFGKQSGKPISPSDVQALRPEIVQRKFTPWTVDELRKLEKN